MRTILAIVLSILLTSGAVAKTGDPNQGKQLFARACAACHSLKTDTNMTGPSLAGVWNRQAGTLPSFRRYSPALKSARITWGDKTLDTWIENPAGIIPGNRMTFPGVKDAQARMDLLSFLKEETAPGHQATEQSGGMGGMMGGGDAPNLRTLSPDQRVIEITHCRDTYTVTTGDGTKMDYW